MKYICNHCGKQYPACIVEVTGMIPEPPYSCLYANDAGDMAADWKEMKDKDYRQESIVSKNKIKIEEMINAHWSYIESVIRTSNEYGLYLPPMTLDQALKIREFDYKTAAKHFYGHGHEDGVIDMAKTTVERLRK